MKSARSLIPLLAVVGILFSAVLSAAFPRQFSSTRSFSIDGDRYALLPSGEGDISLVRRELEKSGIELPRDSEADPPPHPALSFALAQGGKGRPFRQFPIPVSFDIEHEFRLASNGGNVEIVFGTIRRSSQETSHLLRTRGWSCPPLDKRIRGGSVATYTQGKERILAFLEEEEGRFLLVRRLDR